MSQIRVNYPTEVEAQVNKLINLKFLSAYTYTSMACYFDRDDVALPGFSKLFRYLSKRVNKSAKKLMHFQNQRGGRVVFGDVKKPEREEWGTPVDALNICLTLHKNRMQVLQDLVKIAHSQNDTLTVKHINEEHLVYIVEFIKYIGEQLTILKKLPTGSEYLHDKTVEREIIQIRLEEELYERSRHHRRAEELLLVPRSRSSSLTRTILEKRDH